LIPHLLRAGTDDPEAAVEKMRRYAQLLIEWNRSVSNLISGNDEPRILDRHIRESLEPAYWLHEAGGARWLDFGAGAGLPGIPLAIAGIGEHWTMVESRRPKVLFMRKAIETLGLRGIEIYHGRLETLVEETSGPRLLDGFVSRATLHLEPTLEIAQKLVVNSGNAFLWKGSRRDEESSDGGSWGRHWELTGILGVGDGQTAVMRFLRNG
jgi:16S rRNA (guanine527-N7)-methyltransferase